MIIINNNDDKNDSNNNMMMIIIVNNNNNNNWNDNNDNSNNDDNDIRSDNDENNDNDDKLPVDFPHKWPIMLSFDVTFVESKNNSLVSGDLRPNVANVTSLWCDINATPSYLYCRKQVWIH